MHQSRNLFPQDCCHRRQEHSRNFCVIFVLSKISSNFLTLFVWIFCTHWIQLYVTELFLFYQERFIFCWDSYWDHLNQRFPTFLCIPPNIKKMHVPPGNFYEVNIVQYLLRLDFRHPLIFLKYPLVRRSQVGNCWSKLYFVSLFTHNLSSK